MRRIALLSDIHANLPALDAVLADIDQIGIEERYCLGDLVGYGPDPTGVIERVRSAAIPTIRGNYDKGVGGLLGDCGCHYATEQDEADGGASYIFTTGALGNMDRAWLYNLPEQMRIDQGDARILLAHGSPRKDNEYLLPDRTDEQLVRLANAADVDVVCVGHTHVAYHRAVETDHGLVHFVNSGSVGKPKDGDPRACWIELVLGNESEVDVGALGDPARGPMGITRAWLGVLIRRVAYDVDEVAARMIAVGLPTTLSDELRGD